MAKNSEAIEKVLNHQIQILHLLKYLKKGVISPNKCVKSPAITTTKINKNNVEMDTNNDYKKDNHLLLIKTKTSNDKNDKLSTRTRNKVETKSNQIVKKVDVIESSSKSQNIQVYESLKSPLTKKISNHQTNINKVTENDEINENFTLTKQKKLGVYKQRSIDVWLGKNFGFNYVNIEHEKPSLPCPTEGCICGIFSRIFDKYEPDIRCRMLYCSKAINESNKEI